MAAVSKVSLSNGEKIELISNLSTMLGAGIPILDAVNSILEDSKGNPKKILESLKTDLMSGKRVSASLAGYPRAFDKVTVNLIKASEEAGTLETTLEDLRTHIRQEMEFTDKIKFALLYPVLIMVVFILVLLVILIYVVPKISQLFSRMRVDLPLPTRIMIFVSNIMLHYTWALIGGMALSVVLLIVLYKSKKHLVMEFFFSLPFVSNLIKMVDMTRFCRSMFLLLNSGLPITSALDLTREVVFKKRTAKIISSARDMVMSGKRLSDGFRTAKGYFPSIIVKLIESGEKSGTLDKSMKEISEYLDYQVANALKAFTAILEPVMLVLVGVSVGAMMLAIIAPIYGLIGQVGGR